MWAGGLGPLITLPAAAVPQVTGETWTDRAGGRDSAAVGAAQLNFPRQERSFTNLQFLNGTMDQKNRSKTLYVKRTLQNKEALNVQMV